jgi:hypothetical protein
MDNMKQKKRPYATLYYADARGGLPVSQGSCKSGPGFKQAMAKQVFALERYRRVEVVDTETGLLVMALSMTTEGKISHNLECEGREAVGYQWRQKMDAKLRAKKSKRGY